MNIHPQKGLHLRSDTMDNIERFVFAMINKNAMLVNFIHGLNLGK